MTIDEVYSEIKLKKEEKRQEIINIFKTKNELLQQNFAPNQYKLETINQLFQQCAGYMSALEDILILIDKGECHNG